jgi:putative Mg2+ transporter-C (MgtC) family protein
MQFLEFVVAFFAGLDPITQQFIAGLALSIFLGYIMGAERELRGKDAGISTHIFVMGGSMLFTLLSMIVDAESKSRIAAQIVSGIGFLGAGLILKEGASVRNLTTAASIWFSSAIGMAIGFGYFTIAIISGVMGVIIPRIPRIGATKYEEHREFAEAVAAVTEAEEIMRTIPQAAKVVKKPTVKKTALKKELEAALEKSVKKATPKTTPKVALVSKAAPKPPVKKVSTKKSTV